MDEVQEPGFERYTAALRRYWWLVLAFVVIGAVVAVLPSSSTATGRMQVLVVDNGSPFAALTLPSDTVSKAISLRAQVTDEAIATLADEVSTELGRSVKLQAVYGDQQSFTLTVTAPDEASVSTAAAAAVRRFGARWSAAAAAAAKPVAASLDAQRGALQQRMDALDKDIAALPAGSSSLADAYRTERQRIVTDIAQVDGTHASVDAYVAAAAGAVRAGSLSAVTSFGRSTSAVIGAFGGGLLGVACVVVLTVFDRRVRTRRDVERATGLPVLAVVDRRTDGPTVPVGAAALVAAARSGDLAGVALVADRARNADAATEDALLRSAAALDPDLVSARLPAFLDDPDPALRSEKCAVVVVATWGGTHRDDLANVCRALAAGARRPVGVLLVGVPLREVRAAAA